GGLPRFTARVRDLWRRLRRSMPMGYAVVMMQIYAQIDMVMLGYFRPVSEVGQYGVAYRIPFAVFTLAGTWVAAAIPHSSAMAATDRDGLRSHTGSFVVAALGVTVPLAVCTPFVAHGLMTEVFGGRYGPAAVPFALLIVATSVSIVGSNVGSVLLGLREDRYFALVVTVAAAV